MQATVASHSRASSLPPIRVTIVAGADNIGMRISDQGMYSTYVHVNFSHVASGGGLMNDQIKSPSDLFSYSHTRNAARMEISRLGGLRTIGASPGGMRATVDEQVIRWQQEVQQRAQKGPEMLLGGDPEMEAGVGHHPRLGIGLPMCNIIAT